MAGEIQGEDISIKGPDYRRIFQDIIDKKFPEKKEWYSEILQKEDLYMLDVLRINNSIFNTQDEKMEIYNQKLRSYDEHSVLYMLDYQRKNNLTNTQLANHFRLSRNTVAKWKKHFTL
ncbi:helix-turn-helix domain-containing protein [Chryseobacterium sp. GVT01B]|uniref:helix-turn-helix domain-containing protein n=1 Tax=unclassified Chryseobacterium TaxID=2593645 RepID=UPI001CBBB2C7|nr:helix-turn-helix domain-containing protein [Chryseobacterium sp. GVT01B]